MALPAALEDAVNTATDTGHHQSVASFDQTASGTSLYSQPPPVYSQANNVKILPFRDHAALPPIQSTISLDGRDSRHTPLPSISSVAASSVTESSVNGSAESQPQAAAEQQTGAISSPANHWPSLNPLTAYYTPGHIQSAESPMRMDVDSSSTSTGPVGTVSPDRYIDGRASSVSLDDPDVRMAAEALGDLRAGTYACPPFAPFYLSSPLTNLYRGLDFVSSPSIRTSTLASPTLKSSEPLLSLLTTSHPLLAKTIEGTTSAYNSSKNFSPRFKSGAEYVEGYLTPIGNTIGSVSRVTGVEGGVRWFLGGGRRHRHQHPSPINEDSNKPSFYKRRRIDQRRGQTSSSTTQEAQAAAALSSKDTGTDTPFRSKYTGDGDGVELNDERRLSMSTVETLPAYDDQRSPAYTESADSLMQLESGPPERPNSQQQISGPAAAWQTRLIMSTSGLSIAMTEESLRSLKYCLNWLRWANGHIDKVIVSLKDALDQYDSVYSTGGADTGAAVRTGDAARDSDLAATEAERDQLAARIATLRGDLLQTLRGVVDTVSKYAGGALPENARVLVRRHLTSLPQRFRLANQGDLSTAEAGSSGTDKDVREGAQRVLVLAKEGLDMMSQVSGVLDGTIVSAEEWCERLGKKRTDDGDMAVDAPIAHAVPPQEGDAITHQ